MTADHASDETLSALLDRQLPPAELDAATAHVESCPTCAQRVAELREVVALLRGLPDLEPPRDFAVGPRLVADPPNLIRLQRWYTWTRAGAASLAAAFVFLVAGTVYLDNYARPATTDLARAASAPRSAPAVAPAPAPTTAPGAAVPAAKAAAPQPAAPQLAARTQPAAAGGEQPANTSAGEAADQVAAATTARALPTPEPTRERLTAPSQTTFVVTTPEPVLDPAAPVRTAAIAAGVLAVLSILAALVVRHRLARSRAAILP